MASHSAPSYLSSNFKNSLGFLSLYSRNAIASSLTPRELINLGKVSQAFRSVFDLYQDQLKTQIAFFKVMLLHQRDLENLQHEEDSIGIVKERLSSGVCLLAQRADNIWKIYFFTEKVFGFGAYKRIHLGYDPYKAQLIAIQNHTRSEHHAFYERYILSQYNHPNIQNIDDVIRIVAPDVIENVWVTPWATGGSLRACFGPSSKILFSEIQLYDLCLQIALGVQQIHRRHHIHCDLKVDNILIYPDCIKISDFSFCHNQGDDWRTCGTTCMLPPESLLQSPLKMQPSFDIWSLGLILYFVCSRGNASCIENDMKKIYKERDGRIFENFKNPEWVRSTLFFEPDNSLDLLQDLLVKMLSFNPSDRPSISEVVNFLAKNKSFIHSTLLE